MRATLALLLLGAALLGLSAATPLRAGEPAAPAAAPANAAPQQPAPPLRVLILTGQNNHNWKATTPVLKEIFQKCPRFEVKVTTDPGKTIAAGLGKYDVLVSNWTNWPKIKQRVWGPKAEKNFLEFIRGGKGFVVIHAASTPFATWPEFRKLVGSWWKLGQTGHGAVHEFTVKITDAEHPVTEGMTPFTIVDELWHRIGRADELHVLCSARSEKSRRGSGQDEPVVHWRTLGKGRCFHIVLGHDNRSIGSVPFRTLLLRGSEWAATGKVTLPIPKDWLEPKAK